MLFVPVRSLLRTSRVLATPMPALGSLVGELMDLVSVHNPDSDDEEHSNSYLGGKWADVWLRRQTS